MAKRNRDDGDRNTRVPPTGLEVRKTTPGHDAAPGNVPDIMDHYGRRAAGFPADLTTINAVFSARWTPHPFCRELIPGNRVRFNPKILTRITHPTKVMPMFTLMVFQTGTLVMVGVRHIRDMPMIIHTTRNIIEYATTPTDDSPAPLINIYNVRECNLVMRYIHCDALDDPGYAPIVDLPIILLDNPLSANYLPGVFPGCTVTYHAKSGHELKTNIFESARAVMLATTSNAERREIREYIASIITTYTIHIRAPVSPVEHAARASPGGSPPGLIEPITGSGSDRYGRINLDVAADVLGRKYGRDRIERDARGASIITVAGRVRLSASGGLQFIGRADTAFATQVFGHLGLL